MICLRRVRRKLKTKIFDAFRDTYASEGFGGQKNSFFVHFRSYLRASPFTKMCNFIADAMLNFTFWHIIHDWKPPPPSPTPHWLQSMLSLEHRFCHARETTREIDICSVKVFVWVKYRISSHCICSSSQFTSTSLARALNSKTTDFTSFLFSFGHQGHCHIFTRVDATTTMRSALEIKCGRLLLHAQSALSSFSSVTV